MTAPSVNRSRCLISLRTLHGPFGDLRTVDSADVYVSATLGLPSGLISDPQSLISFQNRLRVRPLTSGLPVTDLMFYPPLRHRSFLGTGLYDYYGLLFQAPVPSRPRLRAA